MKTVYLKVLFIVLLSLLSIAIYANGNQDAMISGKVISSEGKIVDYATVYLKDTQYGGTTNQEGIYHIKAPAGNYTLVVSVLGYETVEKQVVLTARERIKLNITITPQVAELNEVAVVSNGITRLKRSAYNAIAIDTKALQNTTQSLSDALAKAPGLKVRESGGTGSDMKIMMDGFTGDHVKVFIDGVPQEGVGSSFALNNIPANYAERIEVYKGVVPVGFGTDAIGGVINVVTKKQSQKWFTDASYSYGSFNTHKSYVNFGQTLTNGFTYEINAFQNYSDNSYKIDNYVTIFNADGTSVTNKKNIVRVKRFHDTFHNESVGGKVGFTGKKWADRLLVGFKYSHMHKDIQNGVKQEIVYGDKFKYGHSLMPSLEYSKINVLPGLDVMLTANYNKNITNNVDTSTFHYNWYGQINPSDHTPGEQTYQYTRSDNNNWNGTVTANYRIAEGHVLTVNHVINSFRRANESLLAGGSGKNPINKESQKNISGLSYRLMPNEKWNASIFGKYYNQHISGPIATTSTADNFVKTSNTIGKLGYGAAGTYFILKNLQTKLSYEKTYRLPTNDEVFGDEDLEKGNIGLKPENSDNINFNLNFNKSYGEHNLYLEGGLIYRDTKDYIRRDIQSGSGGKFNAGYVNHGKVLTKGYNISARYGFSNWLNVGVSYSEIDARNREKTTGAGTNQESLIYNVRMQNVPYRFANTDISFFWHKLWKPENTLSITYDNMYMHSFSLRWENLGSSGKDYVPSQFSHNIAITYAIEKGRYNLSFECKNLTDEKLYDNFSLQKAGRAFYGKIRVFFGN